jgi:pimeloyl-ACP methyl ester carboxylesterase
VGRRPSPGGPAGRAGRLGGHELAARNGRNRETAPEYARAAKAVTLSTKQRRTVVREILLLAFPQGLPQNLGALPLTVLSAGSAGRRKWPAWAAWSELQDDLAALSSGSAHVYAVNADHNVHLDDPGVVVEAIRDLVGRIR